MSMENLIGKPLPENTPEKFNDIELKNKYGLTIAWLRYPDVLQVSNTLLSVQDARELRDYLNQVIPPANPKPRVHAHDLQKQGGTHLAACREFVQRKAMNGERVIWGSVEPVTLTMRDIEEMASEIAAASLNEERKIFYKR